MICGAAMQLEQTVTMLLAGANVMTASVPSKAAEDERCTKQKRAEDEGGQVNLPLGMTQAALLPCRASCKLWLLTWQTVPKRGLALTLPSNAKPVCSNQNWMRVCCGMLNLDVGTHS
jgi:hypothetical protein